MHVVLVLVFAANHLYLIGPYIVLVISEDSGQISHAQSDQNLWYSQMLKYILLDHHSMIYLDNTREK